MPNAANAHAITVTVIIRWRYALANGWPFTAREKIARRDNGIANYCSYWLLAPISQQTIVTLTSINVTPTGCHWRSFEYEYDVTGTDSETGVTMNNGRYRRRRMPRRCRVWLAVKASVVTFPPHAGYTGHYWYLHVVHWPGGSQHAIILQFATPNNGTCIIIGWFVSRIPFIISTRRNTAHVNGASCRR